MNKQQLAAKIWESANNMRSKIEPNEYKDYILGFIFYKFLSTKELNTLEKMEVSKDDLKIVTEDNYDMVNTLKNKNGYFIAYNNLFSTWLDLKSDFDIDLFCSNEYPVNSSITSLFPLNIVLPKIEIFSNVFS